MFHFLSDLKKNPLVWVYSLASCSWNPVHLAEFPFSVIGFPMHLSSCLSFMLLKPNLDTGPAQFENPGHSTTDLLTAFLHGNAGQWVNKMPSGELLRVSDYCSFPYFLQKFWFWGWRQRFLRPSTMLTCSLLSLYLTFDGSNEDIWFLLWNAV